MKKIALFALALSLFGVFAVGCAPAEDSADKPAETKTETE
jgi:hypothetical protein